MFFFFKGITGEHFTVYFFDMAFLLEHACDFGGEFEDYFWNVPTLVPDKTSTFLKLE
jgi:hypothetical protein